MLGYSQREVVAEELQESKAAKAEFRQKIAASDLTAINADPELLRFALAGGEAAFGDNCAPCHGRGAQGAFGYPNLRDDSWLWGKGTLKDIHQTILHGIRADDPETRNNQMPAFGRSGILTEPQIGDAAEYVLSLSGKADDKAAADGERRSPPTIARRVTAPMERGISSSVRPTSRTSFGSMQATRRR